MRTNIVLDDQLVDEAFRYAENISTKKDLIEIALKEFVKNRKIKNLKDAESNLKCEKIR